MSGFLIENLSRISFSCIRRAILERKDRKNAKPAGDVEMVDVSYPLFLLQFLKHNDIFPVILSLLRYVLRLRTLKIFMYIRICAMHLLVDRQRTFNHT